MKEKEIIKGLNKALNARSIDILDQIKARSYQPLTSHDHITTQPPSVEKITRNWFKPFLSLAMSLAVIALVFIGYQSLKPAGLIVDSTIYVDVNPSIIYKVDKSGKVFELEAKNELGQRIINGLHSYKNQNLEVVVEMVLDEMVDQDIIVVKMPTVLISVVNKNQDTANRQMRLVDRTIEDYFKNTSVSPLVINQKFEDFDPRINQQAEFLQISESKYYFVLRVHQIKDDQSITELSKMSLNQLIEYLIDSESDLEAIDPRLNQIKEDRKTGKDPVIPPVEVIEKPKPIELPTIPETLPDPLPETNSEPVKEPNKDPIKEPVKEPVKPADPIITTREIQQNQAIAYQTQYRNDATLLQGTTRVLQEGKDGVETTVIEVTYSDGKEVSRKVISKTVTTAPVPKIVLNGTKQTVTESTRLSLKAARDMVINRFSGVIQKIEYTYDDNNPLYKGEAVKLNQKVVFEINARTKSFVKWDLGDDDQFNDYSSRYRSSSLIDQAINAVIARSTVSTTFVQKIEFKWDSSEPMFVGEAFSKDTKYVFEIDARNLSFYKFDRSTGDETWSEQYSNVRSK